MQLCRDTRLSSINQIISYWQTLEGRESAAELNSLNDCIVIINFITLRNHCAHLFLTNDRNFLALNIKWTILVIKLDPLLKECELKEIANLLFINGKIYLFYYYTWKFTNWIFRKVIEKTVNIFIILFAIYYTIAKYFIAFIFLLLYYHNSYYLISRCIW